jgi:hypothetical protein
MVDRTPARLSRRRKALLAILTVCLTLGILGAGVVAGDVYLHHRLARQQGYNIWGYRGPVAGRKKPRELRVVVLGDSTAWGYGVGPDETIPAYLEQALRARGDRPATAVNLAYNNEGAYSLRFTVADYRYLDYDIACFYQGYSDVPGRDFAVFRHDSAIFRLTGYLPILPIAFREKASQLLHGGVQNVYAGEKTVFTPTLRERTLGNALSTAGRLAQSLDRQFGQRLPDTRAVDPLTGCHEPWGAYCQDVLEAIDLVVRGGKRALIVTQPYLSGTGRDRHVDQQAALSATLRHRYGNDPRVAYVNLGTVLDLADPTLSPDGDHLWPRGNEIIASHLVAPVLQLADGT